MLEDIYEDGKKSLNILLKEKAYDEVKELLKEKGIDINDVSDDDIEVLVAQKVKDMENGLKGFGIGAAFTLALSILTGGM